MIASRGQRCWRTLT